MNRIAQTQVQMPHSPTEEEINEMREQAREAQESTQADTVNTATANQATTSTQGTGEVWSYKPHEYQPYIVGGIFVLLIFAVLLLSSVNQKLKKLLNKPTQTIQQPPSEPRI